MNKRLYLTDSFEFYKNYMRVEASKEAEKLRREEQAFGK